ncbi:hypothetical protein MSAN_00824200 [Mycena sanguinolenta]|uniref:Ig-like domain-containing protein n=1 Tax=Mycena sanguinolenta TaxID=230812 RepID=A0A8H6YUZ4_9AGAR|nr:hypothetical protein MSAN_00824200 [Mycena sanguinolenta]
MTVSTLRFGISVSSRSLLFDFQNIKGLLATGIFFLATLGQTASWTSLLTPNDITVYIPLQGTELDFSSEAFIDQFSQLLVNPNGTYNYLSSTLLSVIDTSGSTSALALVDYPAVLDYAGLGYVGSTGGILPIYFEPDAPVGNRTDFVTFNTKPFPRVVNSFNISMSQQGLTAAVTCRTGQLNGTSDPPFQRFATQAEIVIDGTPYSYTAFWIKTTCAGEPQSSFPYLSGTNDTLIAMACDSSDGTYTVVIDAQGVYGDMGTMMCTVSPQIQNVTAYYYGQFVSTEPDSAYVPINARMNVTGFSLGLVDGIMYGQGQDRNTIGDLVGSIYADQFASTQQVDYVTLWEAYIQGVVEFVGTAIKVNLAGSDGPLEGQPPQNMMKSINGTAITTTLGWQYKERTAFAVLIPSTFIAVASILIVLFTQYRSRGVPRSTCVIRSQ